MSRSVKAILVIAGIVVLWGVLASINAGIIGLGVILSMLALLDIVSGEFTGSNKTVWLMVSMAALFVAVVGIASVYVLPSTGPGNYPVYALSAAVSIILIITYFLIGRRQKIVKGKEPA